MPKLFLHLMETDGVVHDLEGSEYPDLSTAEALATRAIREIVGDRLLEGVELDIHEVQITDKEGNILKTVTVTEAIAPTITAELFNDHNAE